MLPRICNDEYRRLSMPSVSRAATAVAIFRHDAGGSLMLSRYENTARLVLRLNTETAISPVSSLRGECRNLFISSFRLLSKAICCAVGLGSSGVFFNCFGWWCRHVLCAGVSRFVYQVCKQVKQGDGCHCQKRNNDVPAAFLQSSFFQFSKSFTMFIPIFFIRKHAFMFCATPSRIL